MARGNKAKNSFGIPYLTRGNPFLVQFLNAILDALDQLRIQRSVDIDPLPTKDGYLLTIRNPQGGGRARGAFLPFAIYDVSDGSEIRVSIIPGVVNGLPPDIDGFSILDDPAPYLVLIGTTNIYLQATIDAADEITALEIVESSSTLTNSYVAGTGGTIVVRLGVVTIGGGVITSILQDVRSNLFLAVGGGYIVTSI